MRAYRTRRRARTRVQLMSQTGRGCLEFRAARSAYIVLCGISGAFTLLCLYGALFQHPAAWRYVALCAGVTLFVFVWLWRFRIQIAPDRLKFRSFISECSVRRDEIARIRLLTAVDGGALLRLSVESRLEDIPPMEINAKVFPAEAIRAVLDLSPDHSSRGEGEQLLREGITGRLRQRNG